MLIHWGNDVRAEGVSNPAGTLRCQKTEINELKNDNLLAFDCHIRYTITYMEADLMNSGLFLLNVFI